MDTFEWPPILYFLTRLLVAFGLAFPIALERETSTRSLGLRTFPLVAMASCAYILVGSAIVGEHPDAQSRILAGLMTGMGFIGGGAILKHGAHVRGTATAASLWTTGAVGASVAYDRFDIAVVIALLTFLTLRILTPIEREVGPEDSSSREDGDEGDRAS